MMRGKSPAPRLRRIDRAALLSLALSKTYDRRARANYTASGPENAEGDGK